MWRKEFQNLNLLQQLTVPCSPFPIDLSLLLNRWLLNGHKNH